MSVLFEKTEIKGMELKNKTTGSGRDGLLPKQESDYNLNFANFGIQ